MPVSADQPPSRAFRRRFFGLRGDDVAELTIGGRRPIPAAPLAGSLTPVASFGNKYLIRPLPNDRPAPVPVTAGAGEG